MRRDGVRGDIAAVSVDPAPAPKRQAGRPPDLEKAERILNTGWELFLDRGFENVSMEAIAAAAGVSKVTVYKYYPDKVTLFETAVLRATLEIEAAQRLPSEGGSLRERLEQFGLGLMHFLGSPPAIAFYSVLAGELRRHPKLSRRFYDLGPGRTMANLSAIIRDGVAAGEICVPDAAEAAEMLVGAWQGLTNYRLALAIDVEDYEARIAGRVRAAVDGFLRAYAPGSPPTAA